MTKYDMTPRPGEPWCWIATDNGEGIGWGGSSKADVIEEAVDLYQKYERCSRAERDAIEADITSRFANFNLNTLESKMVYLKTGEHVIAVRNLTILERLLAKWRDMKHTIEWLVSMGRSNHQEKGELFEIEAELRRYNIDPEEL